MMCCCVYNHNTTTTDDVGDDDDDDKNNIWSLQMRHVDPPIFTIDNFLSSNECDYLSSLINDDDNNNDSNDKQVKRMSSPTFSSPTTLYPNIHQLYMVLSIYCLFYISSQG